MHFLHSKQQLGLPDMGRDAGCNSRTADIAGGCAAGIVNDGQTFQMWAVRQGAMPELCLVAGECTAGIEYDIYTFQIWAALQGALPELCV